MHENRASYQRCWLKNPVESPIGVNVPHPNLVVLLVALLAATPSVALAQVRPPPSEGELAEAQRQFELGVTEYEAGQLEDALVRFARAHALSQAPELLYNLGAVHERLQDDAEALAAYVAYLEAVPDCAERDAIEARVRMLESELDDTNSHAAPVVDALVLVPSSAPVQDTVETGRDAAPWIVTTLGVVALAGGGTLIGISAMDASTVETAASWSDARASYERAPILAGVGIAALGVGALATVVGIAWGLTASSAPVRAVVELRPGAIAVSGRF